MNKVPVCIRKEYIIFLEWFQGFVWLHTTVHHWTPQTKKNFLADLDAILHLLNNKVVALIPEDNTKLIKFATSVFWQPKGKIMLQNGKMGFIYSPKGAQ